MGHAWNGRPDRLIHELRQAGSWNNESEIIRRGPHLIVREVESDQGRSLEPDPPSRQARACRRVSLRGRKEQRASAGPQKGELE